MERLHAFAVVLVAGVLTVPAALAEPGESVSPIEPAQEVSITTVFDNYTVDARLETRWGFAAVVAAPSTIEPGIRTTGPLRTSIQEQALVVSTAQGLVVMTGCAHPGIVRIVQKAREMSPKENIALVMGGASTWLRLHPARLTRSFALSAISTSKELLPPTARATSRGNDSNGPTGRTTLQEVRAWS
jgi:hypothetical protein